VAAQLPHGNDAHAAGAAIFSARFSVAAPEQVAGKLQGGIDRRIGQVRKVAQRLGDAGPFVEIPPDDAQEFPVPEQPEAVEKLVVAGRSGQCVIEQVTMFRGCATAGQPPARAQGSEELRETADDVRCERAGLLQPRQPGGVDDRQAFSPSASRAACTAGRCCTRSR